MDRSHPSPAALTAAALLSDPSFVASLTAAEWLVLPYTLGLLPGPVPCAADPEPIITTDEIGPLMAAAYRCGRADGERRR